jgi:hypothetical protein
MAETSLPGGPAGRLDAPVEINQVLFRQVRGMRCLQLTNSVVPMK